MGSSSPIFGGENKKYLKPPTSHFYQKIQDTKTHQGFITQFIRPLLELVHFTSFERWGFDPPVTVSDPMDSMKRGFYGGAKNWSLWMDKIL